MIAWLATPVPVPVWALMAGPLTLVLGSLAIGYRRGSSRGWARGFNDGLDADGDELLAEAGHALREPALPARNETR